MSNVCGCASKNANNTVELHLIMVIINSNCPFTSDYPIIKFYIRNLTS